MNFDKGLYTGVIFIDLKKAFDTVDHDILIAKLYHYGITGKELDWFKSYMSNRKQCWKENGHVSKLQDIKCGVPQDSCLGPLLFFIYVNDLPFVWTELMPQCMRMIRAFLTTPRDLLLI